MTDRIDLDELDVPTEDEEDRPNRGDWFWQDEGGDAPVDPPAPTDAGDAEVGGLAGAAVANADDDATGDAGVPPDEAGGTDGATSPSMPTPPTDETTADAGAVADADAGAVDGAGSDSGDGDTATDAVSADASTAADTPTATPRVPYANDDKPVGIPMESGGAGGVSSDRHEEETQQQPEASGPHGGGADDMTMAVSYAAVRRLENLHAALAEAETWTDWMGIVGDVDAHVINKFQRDERLDLDFFNGTGTGPGERLAEIDEHSMFYARRMVLVGLEEAGERAWAEQAGWEFVPLTEAAEGAGWSLTEE